MKLFIIVIVSVIVIVFIAYSLIDRYYGVCISHGSGYDCVVYRGFSEVGRVAIFQNGTVDFKWGTVSVRGPLRCVGNCTPGSLTAIGIRGIYVVEGGGTTSVVFYHLNAYLGYILAVPVALYIYALALIASGALEKMYRGLKIVVVAGTVATALSIFTTPLEPISAAALSICGLSTTALGVYAVRRVRQWVMSMLT